MASGPGGAVLAALAAAGLAVPAAATAGGRASADAAGGDRAGAAAAEGDRAGAAASSDRPVRAYPGFRIPRVSVQVRDRGVAPGYIFVTPRARPGQRTGPTMLDGQGRVVWHHRLPASRTGIGLQPQVYQGKPVLTWGQRPPLVKEGDLYTGRRRDVYHLIAGRNYRPIARVRASGRGVGTDLHEFVITSRDTALILGYRFLTRNLARYGGPRRGRVLDSIVQEIDIKTGRVLLNWSAARRISLRNSVVKAPSSGTWDPYHVNSVSEDSDGNLLLTARHTSAVYRVHRRTGRVIWTLGGKNSDFKPARGADFHYPHDAQRRPDGSLTIFDNRSAGFDKSKGRRSYALQLRLDMKAKAARRVRSYGHPKGNVLATSQGNARVLDNGNVFIGWGNSPWFSEHAPDGRLLFSAHFATPWNQSYRAFKGHWSGTPQNPPGIAASARNGRVTVFASWNGATELAQWRVLGGPDRQSLAPVAAGAWQDFETRFSFRGSPAFVQAEALNAAGEVIGRSAVVAPKT